MRRAPGLTAAITVAALAFAGCDLTGSRVDRGDYVDANVAIFGELPHFPGSRLIEDESTPYRDEENGPVVGYATRFVFTLPRGADANGVAGFYEERLRPRWDLVERLDGPVLNFRRGRASVSVNLESSRAHLLEIAVDHASYGDRD